MSIQKKQHYVPQFYMRNFAADGKFNIINMKDSSVKFEIPIKGQCQINNYYVHGTKNWEEKLSRFESKWAVTIRSLVEKNVNTA